MLAALSMALLATSPGALVGQHDHARSPYADMDVDDRTSLPADEVARLRAGEGMGMALAAELNGYPGPRHVLELAGHLALSPEQASTLEEVRRRMTEAATTKGTEILNAEAELAELFRSGRADRRQIEGLSLPVARLRAELRAIHLAAHVETRALLSEEQIRMYRRHRGYDPRSSGAEGVVGRAAIARAIRDARPFPLRVFQLVRRSNGAHREPLGRDAGDIVVE